MKIIDKQKGVSMKFLDPRNDVAFDKAQILETDRHGAIELAEEVGHKRAMIGSSHKKSLTDETIL